MLTTLLDLLETVIKSKAQRPCHLTCLGRIIGLAENVPRKSDDLGCMAKCALNGKLSGKFRRSYNRYWYPASYGPESILNLVSHIVHKTEQERTGFV